MTMRGVTSVTMLLAIVAAACGGGGSDAAVTTQTTARPTTTSTAPERPTSTTTTMYDPAAVEGQVEAAYLRSWDVYADAVYNLRLDEAALAEVYAGDALPLRRAEIERRIRDREPSLVRVEHRYEVVVGSDGSTADVVDNFTNHQVRIDPETLEPLEEDPDEPLLVQFKMEKLPQGWRIVFIRKVTT
ncbi:MAG: hypothetical protein ACT4OV_03805 [Microthrixaceae bacterium]